MTLNRHIGDLVNEQTWREAAIMQPFTHGKRSHVICQSLSRSSAVDSCGGTQSQGTSHTHSCGTIAGVVLLVRRVVLLLGGLGVGDEDEEKDCLQCLHGGQREFGLMVSRLEKLE